MLHSYIIETQGKGYCRIREHLQPIHLNHSNPAQPQELPPKPKLPVTHIPKPNPKHKHFPTPFDYQVHLQFPHHIPHPQSLPLPKPLRLTQPHLSKTFFDTCPPQIPSPVLMSPLRNLGSTLKTSISTDPISHTRGCCSWEPYLTIWLNNEVWQWPQFSGQYMLCCIHCFIYTMAKTPHHIWDSLGLPTWETPGQDLQPPVHTPSTFQWWWWDGNRNRYTSRSWGRFSMHTGWITDKQPRAGPTLMTWGGITNKPAEAALSPMARGRVTIVTVKPMPSVPDRPPTEVQSRSHQCNPNEDVPTTTRHPLDQPSQATMKGLQWDEAQNFMFWRNKPHKFSDSVTDDRLTFHCINMHPSANRHWNNLLNTLKDRVLY